MNWSDVKNLIEFIFDNKDLVHDAEYYSISYEQDIEFSLFFTYIFDASIGCVTIQEDGYKINTSTDGIIPYIILIPFELDELYFTLEHGKVPYAILNLCNLLKRCVQP